MTQKVLSGSDYLPATWQYSYQGHVVGTPLPPEKWSQSIDPLGRKVVEYFATGGANVGQMLRSEVYESIGASAFSQKTEYVYQNEASLGESWLDLSNPARYEFPRHQKEITTTIDGDTYRTVMTYNSAQGTQGYSFGSPTLTERFAVPSGTTRTQSVAYSHNTNNWIIGLPDKITRNGKLFDDFDFDAKGRLTEYRQFGVRQATVTYHETGNQAGQIHTYKDALNRTTTLTNYKRGQAQNIAMPEGVSVSRVVDDNGWVTSVTNGRGYSTSYDYTDMGWIERIDRHHPWADSVFSYGSIGSGLTQTETRGTSRITLTHDGLLRPIRTKTEDLTGRSNAVYKSMAYDALSRETFSSFPSFSANPATGLDTTYDVLNRATRVRENVAPFATTTTAYLSGARMRVTDPVGAQTTTTYRRFGSPDEGEVIKIQQPEGVTTEMAYDIFGNMLTARQYGSSNGYSVDQTQRYYYDDRLRLCRHSVPETKSTVYSYDDANQMVWRATGRSETANCPALANSNARIFYSYDDLGRVTGVNYPGATPDISHQYDANGNVTRTSNGAATWNYIYTSADQLHRETLTVDGRTYGLVHGYNPTGHRTSLTFPNGKKATFFPDGMGRPTRVQDGFGAGRDRWADNIDYHPNGAVYGINYLNGHTLTQTQNARQLLETIDVGNGPSVAVSLIYDHDANGRVTSIFDSVNPGWNRSFGYDDLGRLETASGPWGTGDYDYDALGNMRRKQLGASVVELDYGTTNRLSRVRESSNGGASFAGWRNYAYDNRGNVTNNGKIAYQYRWTDQPHRMSGSGAAGDFLYDGNLKRVKQVQGGKTIYSVYSQSGAMLYRDNITDNETTAYIPGSGGIRLKNGVPDYTHKDHLGSPVAMTDASGTVLWRELYSPYGLKQIDPAANRDNEGFTGHIDDAASGLTYMQARYYDPNIGRFLSNDPVGFAQGGPGYFNRYAYTLNNPANATDPDGEFAIQIGGGLLGAGLGAVVGAATAAFNGGDIKTGALKGAISGGVIGATGNVALGAAAAAIVGGVDGARAASSKEGATTKSIALGAVSGAIID
ncbi:MAG: RHS repeat-associated core domain-containing protein, partial [Pseudomonadota bacterium]